MSDFRIIKKYPNRRLYDTAISSYITLDDVRELVLTEVPFMVIEARSKANITHATLLQILLEQKENAELFDVDMLKALIMGYQSDARSVIASTLSQCVLQLQAGYSTAKPTVKQALMQQAEPLLKSFDLSVLPVWQSDLQPALEKDTQPAQVVESVEV